MNATIYSKKWAINNEPLVLAQADIQSHEVDTHSADFRELALTLFDMATENGIQYDDENDIRTHNQAEYVNGMVQHLPEVQQYIDWADEQIKVSGGRVTSNTESVWWPTWKAFVELRARTRRNTSM